LIEREGLDKGLAGQAGRGRSRHDDGTGAFRHQGQTCWAGLRNRRRGTAQQDPTRQNEAIFHQGTVCNLPSVPFWARGSAGGEAQGAEASWVVGDQSLWKSQKREKLCRLLSELFCLLLVLSRPLRLAGGMSI